MARKRDGGEGRPRIKTSHGRGLEPGGDRPRTKAPRGLPRAAALVPRGPKKARPPSEAERRDRDGAFSVASDEARAVAMAIAVAAIDKKAVGIEVLDVAGKVDYADFLVVMTGRSDRHAQALAQGIEEALRTRGVRPIAVEGLPHAAWVLMDFGDVVVHVFLDEARALYDIEGLWLDARRLPVPQGTP